MPTLISFIAATAAVAIVTWIWVRRLDRSENATEEYFTGGRALAWPVVAGSLMLTNLSTEQLVGLNGAVFKDGNLVGIAWEALAAYAMIATALLFLPRYLASGFTTTPAFLEKRFDWTTRAVVSGLFLFGYVTVLLPVVLYTGSLAIQTMFNLQLDLWIIVAGIGLLGSGYAIFGGLKSVAISDTLNGVGLLIGGLAVPFLALSALGDGSVSQGLSTLVAERPEALAPLASLDKRGEPTSVPWDTLLTGMMFIQVFYWSTNQVIVQRAMGAKSLAEGQKGVLFAASLKLIGPLMLCLPATIALHMVTDLQVMIDLDALREALKGAADVPAETLAVAQGILERGADQITLEQGELLAPLGLAFNDQVYPAVVRHVLPGWSLGLFAAVLVGSILSSFNSALNSASTLFCLEFYERKIRPDATPEQTVKVGQLFGTALAVISIILAPMLAELDSIFAYLQKINGLYSVPIISIFLVGVLTKRTPAAGAKAAMVAGIAAYAFFTFVGVEGLHWLHGYFVSFLMALAAMGVFTLTSPKTAEAIAASDVRAPAPVDMTPWSGAKAASWAICVTVVLIYGALAAVAQ
ncbi:MAG: solute:sodium symporter family transporter [Deltaproteobacteria bacterium]|nr:solute:sodium symporter family transporter [Deltaproteobacteria bacterium]